MMKFAWPQVTLLFLFATELAYQTMMDGKPHARNHCLWSSALVLVGVSWLLYMGGFWRGE